MGYSKMTFIFKDHLGKTKIKALYEQKNKPIFLNGDDYKNTYRKTCSTTLVIYSLKLLK
jgi:hypothetical protein